MRAQLGRHPLTPSVPDVPAGLLRQLVRFSVIGIASTLAYLLLFLLSHGSLGAQGANLFAPRQLRAIRQAMAIRPLGP